MATTTMAADFIVVGGGLTGCVVASRLAERHPALTVLLIEAGGDHRADTRTTNFVDGLTLLHSPLDWTFTTEPQLATADRVHTVHSGRTLGGGSVLNLGGWGRGDARDYDAWATAVGDDAWTWRALLPYFQKTEHYFDASASRAVHGFEGPIHVASVPASHPQRTYGLRQPLYTAWTEAGIEPNPDPATGSLLGITDYLETWHQGKRQPSHLAYSLNRVIVLTNTTVSRVDFRAATKGETPVAIGVTLIDGRTVFAHHEVILTAGAIKTPQLLLLSGIGPASDLAALKIPLVHNLPDVGRHLTDHFAVYQLWQLRNPEKNYAQGSPFFNEPAYAIGLPTDWQVSGGVPTAALQAALARDEASGIEVPGDAGGLLDSNRALWEALMVYSTLGLPGVPVNGSVVTSSVMLLHPTSRGTVTLASGAPDAAPKLDPCYYTSEIDRTTLIEGVRRQIHALQGTTTGKTFIAAELPFPGMAPLTLTSSDAEIDARIRATGMPFYHSTGTAAMGKVVDTRLRVLGVRGLRVADGSVIPVSIGAHPQATLYALAERAVDIVSEDARHSV